MNETYREPIDRVENSEIIKNTPELDISFKWWTAWAWLGLTIGNLLVVAQLKDNIAFALFLAGINTALMIFILRFSKYAFLIATIFSLNPIVWVINGIYLKNRWSHPKVNASANKKSAGNIERATRAATLSNNKNTLSHTEEENAYELAAQELETNQVQKGLWAKSFADADGVESVAKARYLKSRSRQIINQAIEEKKRSQTDDTSKTGSAPTEPMNEIIYGHSFTVYPDGSTSVTTPSGDVRTFKTAEDAKYFIDKTRSS